MPRKRDIEAAVAAYNDAAQALLLPPSATRLLIVMFPRGAVCQRSLDDLAAEAIHVDTAAVVVVRPAKAPRSLSARGRTLILNPSGLIVSVSFRRI